MAEDDDSGVFGDDTSNPFPPTKDPFFEPTKAKQKAATKKAVKYADPDTAALASGFGGGGTDPVQTGGDVGDIGGKDYRFSEVSANPEGNIKDYSATDPNAALSGSLLQGPVAGDPKSVMAHQLELLLGGTQNPSDISPHEYAALTKEAHDGNKLAQQILVKGKFKTQDYPSLQQDLTKIEDPFVKALSGLPALAENLQAQQTQTTQPYDFNNAEAQVNNLLGQMGSSQQMSANPETQAYVNKLQGIVGGAGNINTSTAGLPSIETALSALGPAGQLSEKASPYASLLAALLSHQQYETIYGGQSPSSTGDPAWLQNLIASVTGTAIGGGLVSPAVAAGGVGTTPSTSSTPTGSNA